MAIWYRTGSITLTAGSKSVVGVGTAWNGDGNARAGDALIAPDGRSYEIEAVNSDTSLTLVENYAGVSANNQPYKIQPTIGPTVGAVRQLLTLITRYGGIADGVGAGKFSDGNPATPGMRFAADEDTGLRRYDANALSIVTGGVDRVIVNPNGVGIGSNNDGLGALLIQGTDQAATDLSDDGAHGGSLFIRAFGNGFNAGGALLLGTTFGTQRPFAAIKGATRTGDANTMGDLIFGLRINSTDTVITERARLTSEGRFGLGDNPTHHLTVAGAGQAANAPTDAGNKGGMIYARDTGASAGSGGVLAVGTAIGKPIAAIKASLTNGSGNTIGDLMVSTRDSITDAVLSPRWIFTFDGHYRPYNDNGADIGAGSLRVRQFYGANGAINTSDARKKQQIDAIPDEWLDAWGDVRHVRFKFNLAVEEKGDAARWHVGYIAQEIRDAFAERGLDATKIGLLCHDQWGAREEPEYRIETTIKRTPRATPSVGGLLDAAGQPLITWTYDEEPEEVQVATGQMIVTREAGDLWSIRPDQCAAIEAAWQRREIARLTDRLAALEAAA